jgi:hypothetical protein
MHLLIVDDDRATVDGQTELLEDAGFECEGAVSFEAAMAGDLSLFRTLEALAIGVQGKRCLWRAAQALVALPHPSGRRSFVELEADAVRQWETIEQHRRSLVPDTFGV